MLAFAEKQMTPHSLRKLSADLLKTSRPLTDEELGVVEEMSTQRHRHHHHTHRHRRDYIQTR